MTRQPQCNHPVEAIQSGREGTCYCRLCELNGRYPIGTACLYWPVMGEYGEFDDRFPAEGCWIDSEFWMLGHGAIVVKVTGRAGGVSVDHLRFSE